MAARFPQSASSLGWRIKPAYASKVKAICWPAGANSLHVLRDGDTATTVITRTAGSAGFNATDGLITGNVNGASTATYFAVTTLSAFSLTEAGPLHYGISYYGDIFGGFSSDMHAIGAGTPLDSFAGTMQIFGSSYVWHYRLAGGAGGTNTFGGGDNVVAFMSAIWQTDSTDETSRNRLWLNGAELVGARNSSAPTASTNIGTVANPLYLGGTMNGSGNTNAHGEAWWVGVGLTDAEAAAITADPSVMIEEYGGGSSTTPLMTQHFHRR